MMMCGMWCRDYTGHYAYLLPLPFLALCLSPVCTGGFNGIRPAVVALIAAPTFTLARSARISLANCWIPIASALLIWQLGVNPIYIILAAGIGGYIYGSMER